MKILYKGKDITSIDTPFGKFKIYQYQNVFYPHKIVEGDFTPEKIELIYKINKYTIDNQMCLVVDADDLKIIDNQLFDDDE